MSKSKYTHGWLFEVPGISFLSMLDRFPGSRIFLFWSTRKKSGAPPFFSVDSRNEEATRFLVWAFRVRDRCVDGPWGPWGCFFLRFGVKSVSFFVRFKGSRVYDGGMFWTFFQDFCKGYFLLKRFCKNDDGVFEDFFGGLIRRATCNKYCIHQPRISWKIAFYHGVEQKLFFVMFLGTYCWWFRHPASPIWNPANNGTFKIPYQLV